MISDATKARLLAAIDSPEDYCSGAKRKQLLVTYDKLIDELSVSIFGESCTNRMEFRQKVNATNSEAPVVKSLKGMLRKQELLFSKDYRDHLEEIKAFLTNELSHLMRELYG